MNVCASVLPPLFQSYLSESGSSTSDFLKKHKYFNQSKIQLNSCVI